jgi:hypothetical protein
MILIGSNFVISNSLGFISHRASVVLKAARVTILRVWIILIGSQFGISSSFNFILFNALPLFNADGIIELRFLITAVGSSFQGGHMLRIH